MQAHKIILSVCSPFFWYTDLQSVFNFMYYGDVRFRDHDAKKSSLVQLTKVLRAQPFHSKVFVHNHFATNFSLFLEPQDDSVLHVSHNGFTRNTQVYEMLLSSWQFMFMFRRKAFLHWYTVVSLCLLPYIKTRLHDGLGISCDPGPEILLTSSSLMNQVHLVLNDHNGVAEFITRHSPIILGKPLFICNELPPDAAGAVPTQVSALLSLCPLIFVVSLWFCLLLYNFLAATVSNSKSVSCPVTTSHFTSQGSDKAHDEYQRVVLCPDGACLRAVHNQQGISCEVHHQLHHVPELSRYLLSTAVANAALFSKLRPETSSHNFGINPQEPSDTGTRILDELTPLLPSTSMP